MRYIEIILKLLFLIFSGAMIWFAFNGSYYLILLFTFLKLYVLLNIILGLVLIFNKKSSYNYPQTKRDYIIRRIEGTVLIVFSILGFILLNNFYA